MSLVKSTAVLAAVLLGALPWSSATAQSINKSQKAQVEANLKTVFTKLDLNHDGYLDKSELAKAFRGPKATPPNQDLYDERGNPTQVYYQARTRYPELVFLWAADSDGDGRVSLPEYQAYGLKIYASQQQQMQAFQQQQLALQRAVQSAKRRAARPSVRRTSQPAPRRNTNPRRQSVHNVRRQQHRANTHYRGRSGGSPSPQQQMVNAMMNWQRNVQHMQAVYQAALRQRWQMQQRIVQQVRQQVLNYQRHMMTAYYRAPQRHARVLYARARSLGRRR